MLKISVFKNSLVLIFVIGLIVLAACSSSPTPEPVNSASLPLYPNSHEITPAQAAQMGVFFSPWKIMGSIVQSGPYKGYELEKTGNTLSGISIYSLQNNPGEDIQTFFETELSKNGWTRGEDIKEETIVGSSWRRGSQVFAVAYPLGVKVMVTLLLNK